MRPLLILSCLFSFGASLFAQQVTLRGKVEDIQGTARFQVDCSDTELVSASFDLNTFLGQQVLITGTRLAPALPPTIDVTSIVASPATFEIPSNPQIGGTLGFEITTTPGSRVAVYAALAPGFRSLRLAGSVFLDPASTQLASIGIVPALGKLSVSVPVPNDPALIGRTAYAQAALFSAGVLVLSNPDCKPIQ